MELRDKAVKATERGRFFRNPFVIIIAALLGLGCLGFLTLLVFLFGILPFGRSTVSTGAHSTATAVTLAQGTPALAPSASMSATPNSVATLVVPATTGTPVVISSITPTATTTTVPKLSAPTGNVPSPNSLAGLYVTGLRVDPAKPRKIQPINFYVTLVNATGEPQFHKICVEVYHPGDHKSFGITFCHLEFIPPGTSELLANGWVVMGIHDCMPVIARAVVRDEDELRIPLEQPGGTALWLDLQVCP